MKCPLLIDDSAVSQGAALLRSGRRMLHACGPIDTPELLRVHDERRAAQVLAVAGCGGVARVPGSCHFPWSPR